MWPPGEVLAGAGDGPKTQAQTTDIQELSFPQRPDLSSALPTGWQEGKLHAPCEFLHKGFLAEGHLNQVWKQGNIVFKKHFQTTSNLILTDWVSAVSEE